ncbi:YqgE/AlgH family protein [Myroides sp. LJL119]
MSESLSLNKGDIILSLPSSNPLDAPFSRTAILIADQNAEGSIGFILNKPMDITLNQLIPTTSVNFTIYQGGPVEQDKIFCVHNKPDLIFHSQRISNELYWGGDYDQIFSLLDQGLLTKQDIRFFLGYTGWDCEQLKNELEDNYWVKSQYPRLSQIFIDSSKDFWKLGLQSLGPSFKIWLNAPENPNLN